MSLRGLDVAMDRVVFRAEASGRWRVAAAAVAPWIVAALLLLPALFVEGHWHDAQNWHRLTWCDHFDTEPRCQGLVPRPPEREAWVRYRSYTLAALPTAYPYRPDEPIDSATNRAFLAHFDRTPYVTRKGWPAPEHVATAQAEYDTYLRARERLEGEPVEMALLRIEAERWARNGRGIAILCGLTLLICLPWWWRLRRELRPTELVMTAHQLHWGDERWLLDNVAHLALVQGYLQLTLADGPTRRSSRLPMDLVDDADVLCEAFARRATANAGESASTVPEALQALLARRRT